MEINRLSVKNITLNKSKIDKRVRVNPRVDIRVVINWNMDNTDIDLHITDPNNENCYYDNPETEIGGRISADNTSGYGPEQFLLRKAIPGKYRIVIDYYGDNQFTDVGPSTIMAEIYTKYADKTEQRKIVCLQLSKEMGGDRTEIDNVKDNVEVAEFEF